jgi:type II secretory pathway pseudopilin PulG
MRKNFEKNESESGFSLVELLVVVTFLLIVLSLVANVFMSSLSLRDRETRKTDAMTSVQAALNVMSREIANAGYGLDGNGLITGNSNDSKIHFRANIENDDLRTDDPGEEIIYYYDAEIDSVVRFDRFADPNTSVVINRVSNVTFTYYNYAGGSSVPTPSNTPTGNTGKVKITLIVQLDETPGQPTAQNVSMTTEVALRNSAYLLKQY